MLCILLPAIFYRTLRYAKNYKIYYRIGTVHKLSKVFAAKGRKQVGAATSNRYYTLTLARCQTEPRFYCTAVKPRCKTQLGVLPYPNYGQEFGGPLNLAALCGRIGRRVAKAGSGYRRGTARCIVSVEILPIATQQCRNYLYDKS